MKNQQDYQAGWTTKITNPVTGKECSGGAARNLRTAKAGGNSAVQALAAMQAVQSIQPIIEAQQVQIQQQQDQIGTLTQSLVLAINTIKEITK